MHTFEHKQKISKALMGNTNGFKKGIIPWNKGKRGLQKGWNKGLTKETDERVKHIAELKIGKSRSEETKNKMRQSIFKLRNFRGYRGSERHQKYVNSIAEQLSKNTTKKIEVEQSIKINQRHWRIIDILVDNKICYEIGLCEQEKIDELKNNGYDVIHLPYSYFEKVN